MEREHAKGCLDKFKSALVEHVYSNSTHPSDFSTRINSIKKFSGRIISISVPKSVKRCSVRCWADVIHAGITNRSSKARNPPRIRTHFAAVSGKRGSVT